MELFSIIKPWYSSEEPDQVIPSSNEIWLNVYNNYLSKVIIFLTNMQTLIYSNIKFV